MRSLDRLGTRPASLPLVADDVVEFHAARLLLLLKLCGTAGRIDGLTKMAKLDFFVRYPEFFDMACQQTGTTSRVGDAVESAMVRHHYGPWDKRYYHVLAHLEARNLIAVTKEKNSFRIALTDLGHDRSARLAQLASFAPIADRMREVKKAFGGKSGSSLKNMIYKIFDREVGQRRLGEVIES
ncbi:hypothetical protein B0G76_1772 [Paraburkholderia sp. BL23I1N1]|uniref:hypothetical protein n=1 Tax=unclassified Paraburkholderia TaxID=2615204 RepID=UPI000A996419|nr:MULTISPECIES: hypothetical protein [unclassified Paraburkholderia]REE18638.1 hypothetical protein B0G71_1696 [Paraburkholderia sp. BL27I4N3]RKE35656.1 hypothetical protein B0G76_1772 [Paraburkholderia sp. BL23I1N1]